MNPISETYNIDCLEYMRTIPDGYFDLAVVDPPLRRRKFRRGGGDASAVGSTSIKRVTRTGGTWAAKYGKKS